MAVHEVYAQIWEGKVQNIIVCDNYEMANYLSRMSYGEEGYAVECSRYACMLGDLYHDGAFWREDPESGEESEVRYIPTSNAATCSSEVHMWRRIIRFIMMRSMRRAWAWRGLTL